MSPSILANLNFSNAAFINIGAGIVMVALTLCGMFYQARKPTQQQARCKYEPFFRQTSTSRLRVNYFVLSQFHAQLMPGPTCADSRFSTNQQSISSATGRLVARLNVWVPLYFRQWITFANTVVRHSSVATNRFIKYTLQTKNKISEVPYT
jgi:hypothetical protein